MTNLQAKIELLFEFEKKLNLLLDEEEYELFEQQQALFGEQLKNFITKHSEVELCSVIEPLKRLQNMIKLLQDRTTTSSKQLKDKSLLLHRNKKKIKAYK